METGKSNLSYLLTLLLNQEELIPSQMDTQIVQNAKHQNVVKNVQKVCHFRKLQEMMFVDILALKMEVGNKEFILVFTEITKLSKL